MKNMIRTLAFAAMLAGSLSTAAAAQSDAPAPRSRTSGLNLGVFVHRFSAEADTTEIDSGTGLGVHVGYGFHRNISVYARGTLAPNEPYVRAPEFEVAHFELGLRVSPGASSWPIRPFVQGALTRREVYFNNLTNARANGYTVGGGLEGFVRRDLAIEVGVSRSYGDFDEINAPGIDGWEDVGEGIDVTTTRVEIGVSWHP
jgi:opacity protein-like surface antigen